MADLLDVIRDKSFDAIPRVLVLHHAMGYVPQLLAEFVKACKPTETIAWLHDFFSLCQNPAMLRNGLSFCGAPSPSSQACKSCVYGDQRVAHMQRMDELFAALLPTVLAPSEAALKFWIEHGSLKHRSANVVPHATLTMDLTKRASRVPLRIAFPSAPYYHKGWDVFEELVARCRDDPRYRFFQFGSGFLGDGDGVTQIRVSTGRTNRFEMIDALTANEIDVAIIWSRCYETFCFTAHEAVAAGAFVVAPKSSGNLITEVSRPGVEQGIGLDRERELFDLFESGNIFPLTENRRYGELQRRSAIVQYLEEQEREFAERAVD